MAPRKTTKQSGKGISFRATVREREMIDRAARLYDMGPSDYARRNIMKQVEIDLADETEFSISPQAMSDFLAALDRPAQNKPRLQKLLSEKSILE